MEVNIHELGQEEIGTEDIDIDTPIEHVQYLINNTNLSSKPRDQKPQRVFMDKETRS